MNGFIKLYAVLSSFEVTITDRRRNDEGVTAIEYALLAAGIAALVGVAALALGTRISTKFNGILP